MYLCAYSGRVQRTALGVIFQDDCPYFETRPSLAKGSLNRLGWLVSKPQGSTSAFQVLGLPRMSSPPTPLLWALGILFWSLYLQGKALIDLAHFSAPIASCFLFSSLFLHSSSKGSWLWWSNLRTRRGWNMLKVGKHLEMLSFPFVSWMHVFPLFWWLLHRWIEEPPWPWKAPYISWGLDLKLAIRNCPVGRRPGMFSWSRTVGTKTDQVSVLLTCLYHSESLIPSEDAKEKVIAEE